MRILATDLDRTLLPNGTWEADAEAIPLFNTLSDDRDILLVYVTGRNLDLAEQAISHYGIRYPDILCSDVGTTIRRYEEGHWRLDEGWEGVVHKASPGWNAAGVRAALSGVAGIREQEQQHQSPYKQSYYVEHDDSERILLQVERCVKDRFDEVLVYSFDSLSGMGLLDLLPNSATKQTALEYLAREFGLAHEAVIFCGDSGNDIFPLTAGFLGVVVKNADQQLRGRVRQALTVNPELKIYFARGDFMGLNGNYASGVIEGCFHYGLFSDARL